MGNPTMAQALGIMSMFDKMDDRDRETKYKDDLDTALGNFRKNPNWTPDRPDFDDKAYHEARLATFEELHKSNEFKKSLMDLRQARIREAHGKVSQLFDRGSAAHAVGDTKTAFKSFEQAYEQIVDGVDLQMSSDFKSYDIIHPDGTKEHKAFNSTDEMYYSMSNLAKAHINDKQLFAKTYLGGLQAIQQHNIAAGTTPTGVYLDKAGNKAYKYSGLVNPQTGKKESDMYIYNGKQYTGEQWQKVVAENGIVSLDEQKALMQIGTEKAKQKSYNASARESDAKAKAAGHEGISKYMHGDEKLAQGLVRTGVFENVTAAMKSVQSDKSMKTKLEIFADRTKELDPTMQDEKDQIDRIAKNLGIDEWLDKQKSRYSQNPGKGIGNAKKGKDKSISKADQEKMFSTYKELHAKHGKKKAKQIMKAKYPDTKF